MPVSTTTSIQSATLVIAEPTRHAARLPCLSGRRSPHDSLSAPPELALGQTTAICFDNAAIANLPSKILSLTIGGLVGGGSSGRHRQCFETIVYILSGSGYSVIDDCCVSWSEGDAIYIPVWAWHQHSNDSNKLECEYLACENALMLQSLGLAVRREAEAQ